MNRSLTAALALIAAACCGPAAHADLDSLLGDWAAAASHDTAATSSAEVRLAPASKHTAQASIGATSELTPAKKPGAMPAKRDGFSQTLTTNQPQSISAAAPQPQQGQLDTSVNPEAECYRVLAPAINPYCPRSPQTRECQCGSAARGSACGCGELLSQNGICHLLGESECRPHRSPVLPPPSNLLQMFRSKNAYSAIWAGYAEETRGRLRNTSPHINGTWNTCDDGGIIEPTCNTCGPVPGR